MTFAYTVLFFAFSLGVYTALTRIFSIQNIRVVSATIQVEVDQKRLPKTLLFFPAAKIRSDLLSANPILADIRFEKWYPHTLVIIPTVRTPVAALASPNRRVFLDAHGIVLGDADTTNPAVPVIFASVDGVRVGQYIKDPRVLTSLVFISGMSDTLPVLSATISDDGVIRAHTEQVDILFTQDATVSGLLPTLQSLLAGFRIKGTLPTTIDLRFNKPVITF